MRIVTTCEQSDWQLLHDTHLFEDLQEAYDLAESEVTYSAEVLLRATISSEMASSLDIPQSKGWKLK